MDGIEMICFEIISNVGMARGSYVEAIDLATEGKFDEARAKIEEGNQFFVKGHEAHADLIQKEAAGEKTEIYCTERKDLHKISRSVRIWVQAERRTRRKVPGRSFSW